MKKLIIACVLIALVAGESCVVRERRVHRRPPPPRNEVIIR